MLVVLVGNKVGCLENRVLCLGIPALRSSNSVLLVVLVVFGISFVVVSVFMPWVFVSSDISFTIGLMFLLLQLLYIL